MSIYLLKSRFQNLLRPLVRQLQQMGVSANAVTHAAGLVSLLVAGWVYWQAADTPLWYALLPLWMLLRMGMNAIDGMLAREFGHASRLGAYLNELWDVLADAALYAALTSLAGVRHDIVLGFVVLAILSEYAGVLGVMVGSRRRYEGPMGKSDRAFVVGLLGLLLAAGIANADWVNWTYALAAALCFITLLRRIKAGLKEPTHE
ncbi:MAG: CDP-alcohol phosphatidyltransferase family protein [Pseudomonadota bacterium]|nr:CDP-alcohol phosphatidyltransferase family protein [Pseudomonadota bacterium]